MPHPSPPPPPPTWVAACALGQPEEQMPVGGTHTEVGLKPQLSPRGNATKEEELKSLLEAAGTTDLHPRCRHCKLSNWGTSKWTRAPVAETGLVLAAVGFVGTYTRGLDQARIWAATTATTVSPGTRLLQSWDMICTGGLVKTTPERRQGQLLAYPRLRGCWEQFQQQCNLWANTMGEKWHNRVHSQVNSSREGKLSVFSPSGSAPISPTAYCRLETQLRNGSEGLYYNK